jgi:hypothetical protein
MKQKPERRLDEIEAALREFDEEFDVNLAGELTPDEKAALDRWARSWYALTTHLICYPYETFQYWRSAHPEILAFCSACTDEELRALTDYNVPGLSVELSFLQNYIKGGIISPSEIELRVEELKAKFLPGALEKLRAARAKTFAENNPTNQPPPLEH